MHPALAGRLAALADDRVSGASTLLPLAADVLTAARAHGDAALLEAARAVCRAQPAMASIWNAAALALRDGDDALAAFVRRSARATGAVARLVEDQVGLRPPGRGDATVRLVTCSSSGVVRTAIVGLARRRAVQVACAEGRPGGEGCDLARTLAAEGIAVELYSDAAITIPLAIADAVVIGADAVTAAWFMNKVGTLGLCAAAGLAGVPVFVAAGRDKFACEALAARLGGREGAAAEVWSDAPAGVTVRNPYFEAVPSHLAARYLTEMGPLGESDLAEACVRQPWDPRLST